MKKVFSPILCLFAICVSCEPLKIDAVDKDDTAPDEIEVPSYVADSLRPYAESFRRVFDSCSEKEAFLFFTDPHLLNADNEFSQADQNRIKTYFAPVKALYDEIASQLLFVRRRLAQ